MRCESEADDFPLAVPTWITIDDLASFGSIAQLMDNTITQGARMHHTRALKGDSYRIVCWEGDAAYENGIPVRGFRGRTPGTSKRRCTSRRSHELLPPGEPEPQVARRTVRRTNRCRQRMPLCPSRRSSRLLLQVNRSLLSLSREGRTSDSTKLVLSAPVIPSTPLLPSTMMRARLPANPIVSREGAISI